MKLDKKQQESFEQAATPLILWLRDNGNPHTTVIVDQTSAEVLSGVLSYHTNRPASIAFKNLEESTNDKS